MAEREFDFRVLSPLGTAFAGKALSVTLPSADGEITILRDHMPMVAVLVDGEIQIRTAERETWIAVSGGFLETVPPGRPCCRILQPRRTASRLRALKPRKRAPSSSWPKRRSAATSSSSNGTSSAQSCS